jgi:hypothetical protein
MVVGHGLGGEVSIRPADLDDQLAHGLTPVNTRHLLPEVDDIPCPTCGETLPELAPPVNAKAHALVLVKRALAPTGICQADVPTDEHVEVDAGFSLLDQARRTVIVPSLER